MIPRRLALALLAADLALASAPARADLSREPAPSHLSREPADLSREPAAHPRDDLSREPAPSASERDLAYEIGVQAEASGEHARAAAAYERAHRLTPAVETGPRLLFLRASVAARLRADDGSEATRVHLCHAQVLLRDYLDDPALAPEPRSAERSSLAGVEQRLARAQSPTCAALLGLDAPPTTVPPPVTTPPPPPVTNNQPTPPTPSIEGPATAPTTAPLRRPLQISGGVTLGLGLTGLVLLASGISIARRANQRGHDYCSEAVTGCVANDDELRAIADAGRRGDSLVRVGAVMAGLGVLAGVTLLALGARRPAAARVSLGPHGLHARF